MRALSVLLTDFRRRISQRQAIRELQDYDDVQLRDLGLARDEIPAYVDGRIQRPLIARARPKPRLAWTNPEPPTQRAGHPVGAKMGQAGNRR